MSHFAWLFLWWNNGFTNDFFSRLNSYKNCSQGTVQRISFVGKSVFKRFVPVKLWATIPPTKRAFLKRCSLNIRWYRVVNGPTFANPNPAQTRKWEPEPDPNPNLFGISKQSRKNPKVWKTQNAKIQLFCRYTSELICKLCMRQSH